MRKRLKKRIPQDILPWARINKIDDDSINLFMKKQARWESGNRRYLQTKLLARISERSMNSSLLNYISKDIVELVDSEPFIFQTNLKKYNYAHFNGITKAKNFCLLLGKGRTFNRKLHISRQSLRKLAKTGLLSGLQK